MADVQAAIDFAQKFYSTYGDNYVTFHTSPLQNVINEVCLGPINSRKILALYFHNEDDQFSKMFCPILLVDDEISKIFESKHYYFLGWTVSDETYHEDLQLALDEYINFDLIKYLVTAKQSALLLIYAIETSVTIFSILHGKKIKPNDILTILQETERNFEIEITNERDLEKIQNAASMNYIGSSGFQQMIFSRLGNRDYDSFEYNEHTYLKEKIAFSKYGPPKTEDGYDKIQRKAIEETYKQIRYINNKYTEWKDQITIAFLYNCLEPKPEEKLARASKYKDYNPNDDTLPIPLYVIRKCHGSSNPCRIFIDNENRVYNSWKDYLEDNKLHKCTMILPKDGKYTKGVDGRVVLERRLSPSCGVGHTILKGTDIASTIAGLTSGGIVIAALIPSIVVAPVALTAAAATGIGVGIYTVIRNVVNVYDRRTHGESISFVNSEARGAYINIVAGALGFVGAGATTAVAELTAKGVNIGQGAQAAFNTIRLMNVSASSISAFNSTYTVVNDWIREQQTPSPLTIMQLKSSILFFENITSHSNLDEKPEHLQKLLLHNDQSSNKEAILRLRKFINTYQLLDILHSNRHLLQEQGINFSLNDDKLQLNNVKIENILFFPKKLTTNLSFISETNSDEIDLHLKTKFQLIKEKYTDLFADDSFIAICVLIQNFTEPIQSKLLRLLEETISKLFSLLGPSFSRLIKIYFSYISSDFCTVIFQFVLNFLNSKINENPTQNDHLVQLETFVDQFVIGDFVEMRLLDELIQHILKLITETLYVHSESLERQKNREQNTIKNVHKPSCNVCGGYYFYKKNVQ